MRLLYILYIYFFKSNQIVIMLNTPFTVCALHRKGKNLRPHIQRLLQWMVLYFYPMVMEAENDGQNLVVRYLTVKFCKQYVRPVESQYYCCVKTAALYFCRLLSVLHLLL